MRGHSNHLYNIMQYDKWMHGMCYCRWLKQLRPTSYVLIRGARCHLHQPNNVITSSNANKICNDTKAANCPLVAAFSRSCCLLDNPPHILSAPDSKLSTLLVVASCIISQITPNLIKTSSPTHKIVEIMIVWLQRHTRKCKRGFLIWIRYVFIFLLSLRSVLSLSLSLFITNANKSYSTMDSALAAPDACVCGCARSGSICAIT